MQAQLEIRFVLPRLFVAVIANMELPTARQLLELRVLPFRFHQDGDVGVGVFPEGEKISVGDPRADRGSIGVRSLRRSRLQGIGTRLCLKRSFVLRFFGSD